MLLVVVTVALCAALASADLASDVAALTAVVEQQATTIQSLEAAQARLQAEVASLTTSTGNGTETSRQVAFSASMTARHVYVGDTPFIFDRIITNLGKAYSPATGIFLAPVSGLYVFHSVVVNDVNAPFIRPAVMLGPQILAVGTVDGGPNNSYDDGSVLVTAHLRAGDEVYVKRKTGSYSVYGDEICGFSGFLVSADE